MAGVCRLRHMLSPRWVCVSGNQAEQATQSGWCSVQVGKGNVATSTSICSVLQRQAGASGRQARLEGVAWP
jgi:hypothetical protein